MGDPEIDKIIKSYGFEDFKWVKPETIEVANWVRFKCMFGCESYGSKASCPPQVPSIDECRDFFSEYRRAVLIHFNKILDNPEDRKAWGKEINNGLIKIERDVFLQGYYKTFVLFMDECQLCYECALARTECHNKKESRPSPEAMGVDVYTTARKHGYPIEVLKDHGEAMDRFSILMVD